MNHICRDNEASGAGSLRITAVITPVCQQGFCGNAFYQVDSFFTIRSGTFCNKDSDWHTIRAGLLRITAVLSMRCFGYCEPEHPGVTCLPITGSGAVFIRGSSVGTEKAVLNGTSHRKRYTGIQMNQRHYYDHPEKNEALLGIANRSALA